MRRIYRKEWIEAALTAFATSSANSDLTRSAVAFHEADEFVTELSLLLSGQAGNRRGQHDPVPADHSEAMTGLLS